MKVSNKKFRLLPIYFLLAASTMLSGCEVITWLPKKIWAATGDKVFGVHNEQQTDMGPRRKPVGNPQGNGPIPGITDQEGFNAAQRKGNYPALSTPNATKMPQNPNMNMPQQGTQNSPYPPMPPMPPIPQSYQQSPNSPQQMPGNMQPMEVPDPFDTDMSADAAYAKGAGGGGGVAPKRPSFLPGNYKLDRVYEPMAAEFVIKGKGIEQSEEEYIGTNGSVLGSAPMTKTNPSKTATNVENPSKSRSANMFPLEQYAPKPTGTVNKIEDKQVASNYPKLGQTPTMPKNSNDTDAAAQQLDKMMKEAEAMDAKKAGIHNLPPEKTDKNPDIKIAPAPAPTQENKPVDSAVKNETKTPKPVPVLKRRKDPNDKTSQIDGDSFGDNPGELNKNDAVLIDEIAPLPIKQKKLQEQENKIPNSANTDAAKNTQPHKQIVRKSEPPAAVTSDDISSSDIAQNNQGSILPKARYTDRRKVLQQD